MKTLNKYLFRYFFPWKGALTDAGNGDGEEGAQITTILLFVKIYLFPPQKGTLTDAGDGDGGGVGGTFFLKSNSKNYIFIIYFVYL